MNTGLLLLLITVGTALIFDFLNGFHDAANSIATVVSTRVLSPALAVGWAAFFNFIAAFGGEVKVAATMGKGVIQFDMLKAQGTGNVLIVIFAAALGAVPHARVIPLAAIATALYLLLVVLTGTKPGGS